MSSNYTTKIHHLLVLTLLTVATIGGYSQNSVSVTNALDIANGFKPKSRSLSRSVTTDSKPELSYTCSDDTTNQPYYYVFNYADNKGFVIISGDKRAKQVLGYSYNGKFDMNNIPDQLKDLLKIYEHELSDLSITPDSLLKLDLSTFKSRSVTLPVSVSPLLGSIKYNQSTPYNDQCPLHNGKRSVTGCVATGTVQVMSYHKYPQKGKGSNDYTSRSGIHSSVNFANATYNWNNVLPSYGNSATTAQRSEIAKIMFHVGVSCNMNYTSSGSSANLNSACAALVDNFGYDANIQHYSRDYYSANEWKTLLMTELAAGRPVLFEGYDSQSGGGHCFVCDGYDANGLYHINWGWGGMADGYFSLDNLNPAMMGAGAGSGNYNSNVAFVGGIQPPTSTSKKYNAISVESISTPNSAQRNGSFQVAIAKLRNSGLLAFSGEVGLALYRNQQFVQVLKSGQMEIKSGSFYPTYNMSNIKIPTNIANGEYSLLIVSKSSGQTEWEPCLSKNSTNNCITLTVTAQTLTMKKNTSKTYSNFASLPIQPSAQSVNNTEYSTFNDYENNTDTPNTNTNSTNSNTTVTTSTNEETIVTPSTPAKPYIVGTMSFTNADVNKIDPANINFSCKLTNKGQNKFSNKIGAYLYNAEGTMCIGEIQSKSLTIEAGKTITANFSGSNTQAADGKYIITLLYTNSAGKYEQLEPNSQSVQRVQLVKPTAVQNNEEVIPITPPATPTYGTKLNPYLTAPIKFASGNANSVDASKLKFTCTIQNQSQTAYKNYISAHLYSSTSKYIGEIGTQICSLKSGASTELSFSKKIEAEPGKYFITIFYIDENDKYQLLQPRQNAMQSVQIVSSQNCNSDNCVATVDNSTATTEEKDLEFVSIKISGADSQRSNGSIMEYDAEYSSWISVTGIFKNISRNGYLNLGLCVVKYDGDYVTDIKEVQTATVPGIKHTVSSNYVVDLNPGKYIITGFVSENDEYIPIGDSKSNYVILNVK